MGKKVIVTTDFSLSAERAVQVAAALCDDQGLDLEIFHCYHYPVPVGDMPFPPVDTADLEKDIAKGMERLVQKIKTRYEDLSIDTVVRSGLASEDIVKYADGNAEAVLLIMGLTGSGKPGQWMFGSTSLHVAHHCKIPVMVIPEEAEWNQINNIVFATDYQPISNVRGMDDLKRMADKYDSTIQILNILKPGELPNAEQALTGLKLEHYFGQLKHSFHFIEDKNVEHGMEEFLQHHKASLVVMVRRKHNWFSRLVSGGHTGKMAYHMHVPLLILHEN